MIKFVTTVLFGAVAALVVFSALVGIDGVPRWAAFAGAMITSFYIGLVS